MVFRYILAGIYSTHHPTTLESGLGLEGLQRPNRETMDYSDLGHFPHWHLDAQLPLRDNGKGSEYSQFWTPEEATRYPDGSVADKRDWLGYVRCGTCGRPLGGYKMVPGPESEEYELSVGSSDIRRYLGWAWKISHPNKRHPGRPQEYHPECSLMNRNWDRWLKAQADVTFDPVYGTPLIKGWQQRLQQTRNMDFGSGRFSPQARKAMFGGKKADRRTAAQKRQKRQER